MKIETYNRRKPYGYKKRNYGIGFNYSKQIAVMGLPTIKERHSHILEFVFAQFCLILSWGADAEL